MPCRRSVLVLLSCLLPVLCGADAVPSPATPGAADEQTLKEANLTTDDAALLQFFRDRTLTPDRRDRILALLARMGHDDYWAREQATLDLQTLGGSTAGLLRQAASARDSDIEIVRRAERVLDALKAPGSRVATAAARFLAQRKPAGTAAVLMAYLPFAEEDSILDEVRSTLAAVALHNGRPDPVLVQALDDPSPLRRGTAAEALVRGGKSEDRPALHRFLKDADAGVRLRVALGLVEKKDREGIPALIALLGDLPVEQAWRAEDVLCRLAGDQQPTVSLGADDAGRKKCRDAWNDWWTKHGSTVNLAKLDELPRFLGYTLVVQINPNNGVGTVVELDAQGKPRWQIDGLQYPVDARVLRDDRVLIAEYQAHQVTERTFKGEIVWKKQINAPISAQRLPGGNTFIACHNQLLVVDADGKEVFHYNRPNHDIMAALRLRDGQFFFVTNGGRATRLDAEGKEVRSFSTGYIHQFAGLDALPGGKVLLPQSSNNQVVEFDAEGKAGWSANVQIPTSAMRLPNGNTVVGSFNMQKIVEVNSEGKQVWEHVPDGRPWKVRKR